MERGNTKELPIQKFHFSMSQLLHIGHTQDDLPSDLIRDLYSIVDNYYLESLSILRSSKKLVVELQLKLTQN